MAGEEPASMNRMIYVAAANPAEREAMRNAVCEAGFLALPVDSTAAAASLLKSGAACDLIIISTDVLDSEPDGFDRLLAARQPKPSIIIYGVDATAARVLHCLNRGAVDFLSQPLNPAELVHAVENALGTECIPSGQDDAIIASSHIAGWIELTASSELEQFRRLQRFSDALFASRLPEKVCEDLKMAVEEVGRNAVEWGNHFDPDKQVHVSYCMFRDRVVIKVEDEGEGFTPQSVPDPTADPMKTMQDRVKAGKRPGGYGVFLIQRLVDDIVYNEKGNTVLLIKYLPEDGAEAETES